MPDAAGCWGPEPGADAVVKAAWDALAGVMDPEIPVLSIVDLGIVYGIEVNRDTATIQLTFTSPDTPSRATIESDIRAILRHRHPALETISFDIVWDPPWREGCMVGRRLCTPLGSRCCCLEGA